GRPPYPDGMVAPLTSSLAAPLDVVRRRVARSVRGAVGGRPHGDPGFALAGDDDPGLFGPDSVAWRIHRDASMFVGGLRALLLQTLHPLAMAGVAEHSDYRDDPWGRFRRTARYIGTTTYGSTEAATTAIAQV